MAALFTKAYQSLSYWTASVSEVQGTTYSFIREAAKNQFFDTLEPYLGTKKVLLIKITYPLAQAVRKTTSAICSGDTDQVIETWDDCQRAVYKTAEVFMNGASNITLKSDSATCEGTLKFISKRLDLLTESSFGQMIIITVTSSLTSSPFTALAAQIAAPFGIRQAAHHLLYSTQQKEDGCELSDFKKEDDEWVVVDELPTKTTNS